MEYVEPEAAQSMSGLRLALTTGVPGPWGEAAKSIFYVKKISYVPVRQTATESNDALVAWTGHRNAPQAIFNDEPPRVGWEEILALAERLADSPSLVPSDERERALMMGMCHAICSEDGLGWNRRHQLLAPMLSLPGADSNPALSGTRVLGNDYGWSEEAAAHADDRICSILSMLAGQLASQKAAGRDYLIGDSLSALDIFWAAFAALIRPLPEDQNPMPDGLRGAYGGISPKTEAALDEKLIAHRDFIYERHLQLPLEF